MIGSAAARHLTEMGHQVTLVGPAEPEEAATWQGPFGSHYDAGRITRQLDPWLFWSRASRASIARYRDLEKASGVAFFSEVGSLMAGPAGSVQMDRLESTRDRDSVPCETLQGEALAARFPYFHFEPDMLGLYEPAMAGVVNPRAMVHAQIAAATAGGAKLLRETVRGSTRPPLASPCASARVKRSRPTARCWPPAASAASSPAMHCPSRSIAARWSSSRCPRPRRRGLPACRR